MASRVSPAERLRVEIDEVFAGNGDLAGAVEQVARLGAQLLLQAALEAEVGEFLGRERYARQAGSDQVREGMRNGYCPTTIKTTAGPVTLERPKLRGTTERFASQLFGTGVLRTNALEALVIDSFVRGLSVRDAEATLTEALGEDAAVSKSAVSRICGQLKEQYETWSRRRLDDVTLDYLFLDASHFKYHPNAGAEPVLAAVGHRHRREAGVRRAGHRRGRVRRRLDRVPDRPRAARAQVPAARGQRRRTRADRGRGADDERGAAAALPDPSRTQHPRESAEERARTGQGRLLGDLRRPRPSSPAWTQSRSRRSASTRSRCAGATPTRPRSGACSPTARASRSTCASRQSTGPGSGTPTSSSGPSGRPAAGSKSSAGSPASTRSPAWSGRCWTGPPPVGAASP